MTFFVILSSILGVLFAIIGLLVISDKKNSNFDVSCFFIIASIIFIFIAGMFTGEGNVAGQKLLKTDKH